MQDQERDLIDGLFNRLKTYEAQSRDPEAERLIASRIAGQPGSPYLLTQTVLVQEHALKAAQQRIAELEAKVSAAADRPGFLENAPRIGPWGAAPAAAPTAPGVPARSPLQTAVAQPAGGGFLRSALATAAGVAGGALLFDGIRNLFAQTGSPFGSYGVLDPAATDPSAPLMPPDQVSSADLSQDDSATDDYDAPSNDSSDDSSSDDFGDDSSFDDTTEV
jgi:hypothetical protein